MIHTFKPATVWSDLEELKNRNFARLAEAKIKMGNIWLHHPDNHVKRISKENQTKAYKLL